MSKFVGKPKYNLQSTIRQKRETNSNQKPPPTNFCAKQKLPYTIMRKAKFILSPTILKPKSIAITPSQVSKEHKKDMEKALDSITGKPESQRSSRFLFSRQYQHYHRQNNEEQIPKQVEYQNRLDEGRTIPE